MTTRPYRHRGPTESSGRSVALATLAVNEIHGNTTSLVIGAECIEGLRLIGTGRHPVELDIVGKVTVTDKLAAKSFKTVGDIEAGGSVISDNDVTAEGNVNAADDVTAEGNVSAANDVTAGQNVSAANDVTASYNVSAGNDVTADHNISAKNQISAGSGGIVCGGDLLLDGGIVAGDKANGQVIVKDASFVVQKTGNSVASIGRDGDIEAVSAMFSGDVTVNGKLNASGTGSEINVPTVNAANINVQNVKAADTVTAGAVNAGNVTGGSASFGSQAEGSGQVVMGGSDATMTVVSTGTNDVLVVSSGVNNDPPLLTVSNVSGEEISGSTIINTDGIKTTKLVADEVQTGHLVVSSDVSKDPPVLTVSGNSDEEMLGSTKINDKGITTAALITQEIQTDHLTMTIPKVLSISSDSVSETAYVTYGDGSDKHITDVTAMISSNGPICTVYNICETLLIVQVGAFSLPCPSGDFHLYIDPPSGKKATDFVTTQGQWISTSVAGSMTGLLTPYIYTIDGELDVPHNYTKANATDMTYNEFGFVFTYTHTPDLLNPIYMSTVTLIFTKVAS